MIMLSRQRRFSQCHRLRASHTQAMISINRISMNKTRTTAVPPTNTSNKRTKTMLVTTINMAMKMKGK